MHLASLPVHVLLTVARQLSCLNLHSKLAADVKWTGPQPKTVPSYHTDKPTTPHTHTHTTDWLFDMHDPAGGSMSQKVRFSIPTRTQHGVAVRCLCCYVRPPTFLTWNNLCDLVYQTPTKNYQNQIPVAFSIPGHVTTKHLPDTPC